MACGAASPQVVNKVQLAAWRRSTPPCVPALVGQHLVVEGLVGRVGTAHVRGRRPGRARLAGHSARRRMEHGLLSSRYLLVRASSNLPSALWANQEIDAVLQLDVENQTRPKVLVLKLNGDSVDTSIPPLLRGKRWLEYSVQGTWLALARDGGGTRRRCLSRPGIERR
jgi:hypothetical protein